MVDNKKDIVKEVESFFRECDDSVEKILNGHKWNRKKYLDNQVLDKYIPYIYLKKEAEDLLKKLKRSRKDEKIFDISILISNKIEEISNTSNDLSEKIIEILKKEK
ncbi:MAG: hypothetical protein ACMXYK_02630 [Candidatus Woesearchaeota archaeon]